VLATTLDGLWALQVFTGIETLCPELGLRPHLPRAAGEQPQVAVHHPVVRELVNCGAVTLGDDGPTVDKPIAEWMTVISRREVALLLLIHQPLQPQEADGGGDLPTRVALSRFGQWWVSLARYDNGMVRIGPMGTATTRDEAAGLVCREVESICGANDAARFEPIAVAADRLRALATNPAGLEQMLIEEGANVDQLRAGLALADVGRSAQCSVVALQSGQGRPVVTDHFVTVGDTARGRVMVKNIRRSGQRWTVLAPGARHSINTGIVELLSSLPAGNDWFSIRNPFG
jgi:hypothetical protein